MKATFVFLTSLLVTGVVPALGTQNARLTGHWEGFLVLAPAEQEVDVVVDFDPGSEQVRGKLRFPMTVDAPQEVGDLAVQESHVTFSVRDTDGVVTAFEGLLSPDGLSLQGNATENGRSFPFVLRRAKASEPTGEIRLVKLTADGIQLKTAFNEETAKTRLLLLLTMGSFSSRMALRIVERYVLDQFHDSSLRVYAVWLAPDTPEAAKHLQRDASLSRDPRVVHFWLSDPSLLKPITAMLPSSTPMPNVCLLFAPGRSWTTAVPTPDRLRLSLKINAKIPVNYNQKLNGIDLAEDVLSLMATSNTR